MAVSDGQRANDTNFNNAFLCKTTGGTLVGILVLDAPASGASVANVQQAINDNITNIQNNLNEINNLYLVKEDVANKDQPLGYAGLDANGRIATTALPLEAIVYRGVWDASTNTPTLANGTGTTGDVYRVSVAGSQDLGAGSENYAVGDWVTYNGTVWERSDFVGAGVLNDLNDVDTVTNPPTSDNFVLGWDNTAMKWVPKVAVAQENVAWVPQGTGSWDGTTFDLVLSADCFLSVPPLPNDYHTIQAQTINFPNDGDIAFVTIDRAAAATTNLTVTVTDIASFVNNGSNIIIGRRLGNEVFVGIHDPQRFQDGDEFNLSKGGGGFTGVREINESFLNTLTSNVTLNTTLGDLTFSNLVVGKKYVVKGMFAANVSSGADNLTMSVTHNGSILCQPALNLDTTGAFGNIGFETGVFTATDTTVTFVTASVGPNTTILGNGTTAQSTWAELEVRNDLDSNIVSNTSINIEGSRVRLLRTATLSTASTETKVTGFASSIDTANQFDSPNDKIIIAESGRYKLYMSFAAQTFDADVQLKYKINGGTAEIIARASGVSGESLSDTRQGYDLLNLVDLDELEFFVDAGALARNTSDIKVILEKDNQFEVYGVLNPETEYIETIINNNTTTSVGDLEIDVVGSEITVPAGTYDLAYETDCRVRNQNSTANTIIGRIRLTELDNTLVDDTESVLGGLSLPGSIELYTSAQKKIEVTNAVAKTYKLRITCSDSTATGDCTILGSGSFTSLISGDNLTARVWARKVK